MTFRLVRWHAFARASLESVLFTTVAFVMAAALFYLAVHQAMLQWEFAYRSPIGTCSELCRFLTTFLGPAF